MPTWIKKGLIDYVAPCDFFYTDFNAKHEEFTALARKSKCMVYAAVHPILCRGDDELQATVESLDAQGKEDIVIDELEVPVVPRWKRPAL